MQTTYEIDALLKAPMQNIPVCSAAQVFAVALTAGQKDTSPE